MVSREVYFMLGGIHPLQQPSSSEQKKDNKKCYVAPLIWYQTKFYFVVLF
jgi:hypothetical protein